MSILLKVPASEENLHAVPTVPTVMDVLVIFGRGGGVEELNATWRWFGLADNGDHPEESLQHPLQRIEKECSEAVTQTECGHGTGGTGTICLCVSKEL